MGQNKTLQSDLNAYLIPAAFPCPAPWPYFRHGKSQDAGLTLVELVLVVVLLALITTLAVTRLDSITGWKLERDL
ncbi:MAG: prepilin-type N-terminal cleavage/methylation domain-containing protein, partial [Deltaproteobacteria bacterium]|nr:prepilin-type N-terminal cleavage/methylation domain-containing protein [Deltaproteobacteria bacterium]